MTREEAYDRAKALVTKMGAVNADAQATEAAVEEVADAIFDAAASVPLCAFEARSDGQSVRYEAPTPEEVIRFMQLAKDVSP